MAGLMWEERAAYAVSATRERPWWTAWLLGFLVFTLAMTISAIATSNWLLALFQGVLFGFYVVLLARHLDQPRKEAVREAKRERLRLRHLAWRERAEALQASFFEPQGWTLYLGTPSDFFTTTFYVALYPPLSSGFTYRMEPPVHVLTTDPEMADKALADALAYVLRQD